MSSYAFVHFAIKDLTKIASQSITWKQTVVLVGSALVRLSGNARPDTVAFDYIFCNLLTVVCVVLACV